MFTKRFSIITILICYFIIFLQTAYGAKSVFIISSHDSRRAEAFRIDGNNVSFQDMIDISTYNPGVGPVGVAVWPEKDLAFFTFEGSPMIVWSSTKTLEKIGEFNTGITSGNGLAGTVTDKNTGLIYVLQRREWYSFPVYVYSFDNENNNLSFESQHDLQFSGGGTTTGYGLALDEENNLLYITDNSNRVHYYDTNSFDLRGYIDITVGSNERAAVGIAVDPNRGYLYTGNFSGSSGSHNRLVRTSLTSPYTSIDTNDLGGPVIGIDVDKSTGLVYCTTHTSYGQYTSDFRVYDSGLTLLDIERNGGIESPAGVAVGGLYKPPLLKLAKHELDPNDPSEQVLWGDYVTYRISYDANGHGASNVEIIDYLPAQVDFNSASEPNSSYDSGSLILTVRIDLNAATPLPTIANYCEMESDSTYNTACSFIPAFLYVDKNASGSPFSRRIFT
jgi:uncharacterized repeat protein (TIGR01451 family)